MLDAAPTDTISRAADNLSRQPRFKQDLDLGAVFDTTRMWVRKSWMQDPQTIRDPRLRDIWLLDFIELEPHLAGMISSAVEINKNRGWSITGAMRQVRRTSEIFYRADNKGWRHYFGKQSVAYYCTRMGAVTELARTLPTSANPDDPLPPLAGIYNIDPTACRLIGNVREPLEYQPYNGATMRLKKYDFMRAVSMPDLQEKNLDYGNPVVARCLAAAQMMLAVFDHDKETLGAAAPAGFLSIYGISQPEFQQMLKERKERRSNDNVTTYRDIFAICSNSVPVEVKLTALSQLPQNWSLIDWVQMLMQVYSLCIGYDVSEFYSVRAGGGLGIATATETQAEKATAKGEWDFILTWYEGIKDQISMTVSLSWDERSDVGDSIRAKTEEIDVGWIAALYDLGRKSAVQGEAANPLLTDDQIRSLLAARGIIPRAWIGEDDSQNTDLGVVRQYREKALDTEEIRRSAMMYRDEPVIRKNHWGDETVLWNSGEDMLRRKFHALGRLKVRAAEDEVDAEDVEKILEEVEVENPRLAEILNADTEDEE